MNLTFENYIIRALDQPDEPYVRALLEQYAPLGALHKSLTEVPAGRLCERLWQTPGQSLWLVAEDRPGGTLMGAFLLDTLDWKNGNLLFEVLAGHRSAAGTAAAEEKVAADRAPILTAALQRLARFAFEQLRLETVTALALAGDEATAALLEGAGWRREVCLRARVAWNGRCHGLHLYQLVKEGGN